MSFHIVPITKAFQLSRVDCIFISTGILGSGAYSKTYFRLVPGDEAGDRSRRRDPRGSEVQSGLRGSLCPDGSSWIWRQKQKFWTTFFTSGLTSIVYFKNKFIKKKNHYSYPGHKTSFNSRRVRDSGLVAGVGVVGCPVSVRDSGLVAGAGVLGCSVPFSHLSIVGPQRLSSQGGTPTARAFVVSFIFALTLGHMSSKNMKKRCLIEK